MTDKTRRQPTHRPPLAQGDKPTTAIELSDASWAILDTVDFTKLTRELGLTDQWFVVTNGGLCRNEYVRLRIPETGRSETVGRLIVGAMPTERLLYRDGNPRNLTRRNLILVSRRAHRALSAAFGRSPKSPLTVNLDTTPCAPPE